MASKYSKGSQDKVEKVMHEMKEGKLKSGRSGKKVTSRKQAIAIGLSEARAEGKKVPKKAASKKSTGGSKKAASKKSSGGSITTLNVFYNFNGLSSADAGAYSLSGTNPFVQQPTNFSNLALSKNATSTLEIGAVLASGNKGAKLSNISTVITYIAP